MTYDSNPFEQGNEPEAGWEDSGNGGVQETVNPEAISVTLKAGSGFEAPWIVVKGGSAAEVKRLLQDVGESKLMELTSQAAAGFRKLNGGQAAQQGNSRPPQRKASNGWQPQQQAAPQGNGPSCQHGPMNFKEGISQKTNKPYSMWVCTQPYGSPDQCRPVAARNPVAAQTNEPPF